MPVVRSILSEKQLAFTEEELKLNEEERACFNGELVHGYPDDADIRSTAREKHYIREIIELRKIVTSMDRENTVTYREVVEPETKINWCDCENCRDLESEYIDYERHLHETDRW